MELISYKSFENGTVYALRTSEGNLIETTDTFLPYYTKDAIGRKQNRLDNTSLGSRSERWMVGVSCMHGCPVRCGFCQTGAFKTCKNLTTKEVVDQFMFVLAQNAGISCKNSREFKINYTRMGEPFLNIDAIKGAINHISQLVPDTHHFVSTIGIRDSDFSWITGNTTLQISLHSLDESRRNELIPFHNKMTIKELGQIRTRSNLKTTVNLTLVDKKDFNISKLKEYFDPEYFFIKLSPININKISVDNALGNGIITGINLI